MPLHRHDGRSSTIAKHRPLAALAMLTLSASAFAAANPPSPMPSAEMRQAMKRDLGMDAGQIARYTETERNAARKQHDARRALGADFAGAWFERDATGEFKLVVGSTGRTAAAKATTIGADVRRVRFNLMQLDDSMSRLNRARGAVAGKRNIHSWRVDLPSNTVVVTAAPGAEAAAAAFVAASGADARTVRIETSALRPQLMYDLIGGNRYSIPPSANCSIGLSVSQGGFVTAGHCGTANTAVIGENGVAIGAFAASNYPGTDMAWVRATNTQWISQPAVRNSLTTALAVVGGIESSVGAVVCRSGFMTGFRCGYITSLRVTVNYGGAVVSGLVQSSACASGGDSGGAFITPGGEGQGVTSGGVADASGGNCSSPSPITYHQPLQPILNAYGLTLLTYPTCGRVNPSASFSLGSTLAISCDGRYKLKYGSEGSLKLYNAAGIVIWATSIYGRTVAGSTTLNANGNLEVNNLYARGNRSRWTSGTQNHPGATLFVQNDGNMVIYDHYWQPIWASNTAGR